MINREQVFRNALDSYYVHLCIDNSANNDSRLATIDSLREYLNNGGNATKQWAEANFIVLLPAFREYKRVTKIGLEDDALQLGLSEPNFNSEEYRYIVKVLLFLEALNRVSGNPI